MGYHATSWILRMFDMLPRSMFAVNILVYFLLGILLGGILCFFLAPYLFLAVMQVIAWAERRLQRLPTQDVFWGSLGLIIGLIIANLLALPFYRLPWIGQFLPILSSAVFGYLGVSIAVKKREEIFSWGTVLTAFRQKMTHSKKHSASANVNENKVLCACKILDTSVIIDGRIADIVETGFLEGVLVVPTFVLEELQHIADSSDSLKRNRGRRGLDILNKMQKQPDIDILIDEHDLDDDLEVDSKLVKLAQMLDGKVLTNDYNLNKVAELQGVEVLNINELSNAVKSIMLPGEEMRITIVKEGKEHGQGVAYLEDGTMIVVDGGRRFIGQMVTITVTSVLQTAAGRMIFARTKSLERIV